MVKLKYQLKNVYNTSTMSIQQYFYSLVILEKYFMDLVFLTFSIYLYLYTLINLY